jgi:hypothetical protein
MYLFLLLGLASAKSLWICNSIRLLCSPASHFHMSCRRRKMACRNPQRFHTRASPACATEAGTRSTQSFSKAMGAQRPRAVSSALFIPATVLLSAVTTTQRRKIHDFGLWWRRGHPTTPCAIRVAYELFQRHNVRDLTWIRAMMSWSLA